MTCDVPHSYVWHDAFTCMTWLIHCSSMYGTWLGDVFVTRSCVWRAMFTCVTRLIRMCDMTHASFIHMCNMTQRHVRHAFVYVTSQLSHVWHDAFTCVTWLIHHLSICVTWLSDILVTWLCAWLTACTCVTRRIFLQYTSDAMCVTRLILLFAECNEWVVSHTSVICWVQWMRHYCWVLQCVAVRCRVLQSVAVCCRVWRCVTQLIPFPGNGRQSSGFWLRQQQQWRRWVPHVTSVWCHGKSRNASHVMRKSRVCVYYIYIYIEITATSACVTSVCCHEKVAEPLMWWESCVRVYTIYIHIAITAMSDECDECDECVMWCEICDASYAIKTVVYLLYIYIYIAIMTMSASWDECVMSWTKSQCLWCDEKFTCVYILYI